MKLTIFSLLVLAYASTESQSAQAATRTNLPSRRTHAQPRIGNQGMRDEAIISNTRSNVPSARAPTPQQDLESDFARMQVATSTSTGVAAPPRPTRRRRYNADNDFRARDRQSSSDFENLIRQGLNWRQAAQRTGIMTQMIGGSPRETVFMDYLELQVRNNVEFQTAYTNALRQYFGRAAETTPTSPISVVDLDRYIG